MKNLPIGIQTFSDFPDFNFVYVDKTELIHKMVTTGKYYFLSRPRRFGKSLLVSTMKELFQGNKKLFEGLWVYDKWDWSKTFPVIHFSFDAMSYKELGLEGAIIYKINEWAEYFEVSISGNDIKSLFEQLLKKASAKHGKIALLVDEYDKPIIDFLEYEESGIYTKAKENQAILRSFYAVLKNSGEYLRFLFVTGISKFSKVSMFSDLNHLNDISLHPDYMTLVGYTQEELEIYFEDYIQEAMKSLKMSRENLLENMRLWYNGFSWDGENKVYNPFGTLKFLAQKSFLNYWFSTGTPTLLLFLMKKQVVFDFENTSVNAIALEKFDIENLELVPLLFQTGYLTIKEADRMSGNMILDYPNKEVRESMYQFMINGLTQSPARSYYAHDSLKDLLDAFANANLDKVKETINNLLAGLPSEVYDKKSEGLYHGLLHFVFKLLGIYIKSEVHSSKGRADSIVETPTHVFIFEFKFNRSAREAMQQIKDKKYADTFRTSGKKILGIGANFISKDKEIKGWEIEQL